MRLNDNVFVGSKQYPKGCRPPAPVAEQIGEHAWEDGDPTVDCPVHVDEAVEPVVVENAPQAPDTSVANTPAATEVAPVDEPDDEPDGEPETAEPYDNSGWLPTGSPDDEPAPPALPDPLPPEPKRAGRGASRAAWADYAAELHLTTTEDQNRDDIIAMVDAHVALHRSTEQA